MLDFEVMFDNARYYNEEDSQVYQVQLCVIILAHNVLTNADR